MTSTPPILDKDVFDEICLDIQIGKSLTSICKSMRISYATVTHNIREVEEYAKSYARAREIQADFLAEEARDILNEPPAMKYDQFGNASIDPAWVQLQKNKAEQLKWHASKLKPKVYGDSTTIKGDKDNPLIDFASALTAAREAIDSHRASKLAIEDKGTIIDNIMEEESPI